MAVVVWSERDEPGGGPWRDCTYSAALMALVHAGELDYPLGIYSVAEREALEASDSRPDETGANAGNADEAIRNRYNRELHRADRSLAQLLALDGLAIMVPGSLAVFRDGHPLRRWDPTFTGGHRVTVVTGQGSPTVRWLDPEAPMGFAGDDVSRDDVLAFFGNYPVSELRYSVADEFVVAPAPAPPPEPAPVPPAPGADVAAAVLAEYQRVTQGLRVELLPAGDGRLSAVLVLPPPPAS